MALGTRFSPCGKEHGIRREQEGGHPEAGTATRMVRGKGRTGRGPGSLPEEVSSTWRPEERRPRAERGDQEGSGSASGEGLTGDTPGGWTGRGGWQEAAWGRGSGSGPRRHAFQTVPGKPGGPGGGREVPKGRGHSNRSERSSSGQEGWCEGLRGQGESLLLSVLLSPPVLTLRTHSPACSLGRGAAWGGADPRAPPHGPLLTCTGPWGWGVWGPCVGAKGQAAQNRPCESGGDGRPDRGTEAGAPCTLPSDSLTDAESKIKVLGIVDGDGRAWSPTCWVLLRAGPDPTEPRSRALFSNRSAARCQL